MAAGRTCHGAAQCFCIAWTSSRADWSGQLLEGPTPNRRVPESSRSGVSWVGTAVDYG
jgi:hypothetical protein